MQSPRRILHFQLNNEQSASTVSFAAPPHVSNTPPSTSSIPFPSCSFCLLILSRAILYGPCSLFFSGLTFPSHSPRLRSGLTCLGMPDSRNISGVLCRTSVSCFDKILTGCASLYLEKQSHLSPFAPFSCCPSGPDYLFQASQPVFWP